MDEKIEQELTLLRHSVHAARTRVNDELDAIEQEIERLLPNDIDESQVKHRSVDDLLEAWGCGRRPGR